MEVKDVVTVQLSRGWELANQLKNKLLHCHPTHPRQELMLLDKIVSSYNNALSLLHPNHATDHRFRLDYRRRKQGADTDDDSDRKHVLLKRKMRETWSRQVRVLTSSKELDGPLSDGHTWRKYGQKRILGTLHPRAYYRCAYKDTQGCLATKQVQRTDENPSIFQVNYKGNHSCIQVRIGLERDIFDAQKQQREQEEEEEEMKDLRNVKQKISPETQKPGLEERPPSPSFPSSLFESNHVETHFFSDGMDANGCNVSCREAGFEPSLATYESYMSDPQGLIHSNASSESEFGEMIFDKMPLTLQELDVSTVDPTSFDLEFTDYIDGFE